jgi:hypothetical protein
MNTFAIRQDSVSWVRSDDVVVVLDLTSSTYLTLNESGTALWLMLVDGASSRDLELALIDGFGISASSASADVDDFLADLKGRALLETT